MTPVGPWLIPPARVAGTILEAELGNLATRYVGQFADAAARLDPDPAAVAHGLFLLAQAAEQRRKGADE